MVYAYCGGLSVFNWSLTRCRRTKFGSSLSDVAYIISGVIQGSCLGHILFLLYINDLPDVFHNALTLKLFAVADDVNVLQICHTVIKHSYKYGRIFKQTS